MPPDQKPPQADIVAYSFDGHGGSREISPHDLGELTPGDGEAFAFAWVHVQKDAEATAAWLARSGLDEVIVDALTAEETRPRCTVHGEGAVINLRGVNLRPGEDPEDMISIRFWVEAKRVIGVWVEPLEALDDIFAAIERRQSPVSPGDLIARLALRLADRAEPAVEDLDERMDDLEEALLGDEDVPRRALAHVRHTAILLRRYMAPQRDALATMEIEDVDWLSNRDRSRLREAADRVTRLGEELDAIRDRAQIVHDQVADRRAEEMNRNMLLLSVVAAIFLPLSLLTGLLGINVGGIPGAHDPIAFWVVCALLVVIAVIQFILFRKFRVLR